jgi:hypothetical protein
MTGYAQIRIGQERYVLITHVGCGRVKLRYESGPAISMWDGTVRYPWVYKFDGFEAFKRSGYMFLANAMLREFDRQRRAPMRVTPIDVLNVDTAAAESDGERADSNSEESDPPDPDPKLRWATYCWKEGKFCLDERKEAVAIASATALP